MKAKNTLFLLLQCLTFFVYAKEVTQCTVTIENELEGSSLEYGDLQLLVVQPMTGKIVETFPCTPDGNCFAIVQDIAQFSLRISGPSHALFEPKQILIGASESTFNCNESLTFTLKGYRCEIPVKVMTENDQLVAGPAGISIRLKHNIPNSFNTTVLTDENGIATFEGVPDQILNAYFEQDKKDNGLPLYWVEKQNFQVLFKSSGGFLL